MPLVPFAHTDKKQHQHRYAPENTLSILCIAFRSPPDPHLPTCCHLPPEPPKTATTPNRDARGQSTARRSHACGVVARSLPFRERRLDLPTLRYTSRHTNVDPRFRRNMGFARCSLLWVLGYEHKGRRKRELNGTGRCSCFDLANRCVHDSLSAFLACLVPTSPTGSFPPSGLALASPFPLPKI